MHRRFSAWLIAALLAAPGTARAPQTADAVLKDRVPGKPQSCITLQRYSDSQRTLDDHSLLYQGYGSTVYLNHPADCPALTSRRGIVSVTPSDHICSGDIVHVIDFASHFDYGTCILDQFVPYSKPKR